VLIYFAFKVERLENVWRWTKKVLLGFWRKMALRRKGAKGVAMGGLIGGAIGGGGVV